MHGMVQIKIEKLDQTVFSSASKIGYLVANQVRDLVTNQMALFRASANETQTFHDGELDSAPLTQGVVNAQTPSRGARLTIRQKVAARGMDSTTLETVAGCRNLHTTGIPPHTHQ